MINALIQQSFETKLNLYFERDQDCAWLKKHLEDSEFLQQLQLAWGCSDFAADQAASHPDEFRELVESGDLESSYSQNTVLKSLKQIISAIPDADEKALAKQLRLFRRREMQRIIWRDLNRLADVTETTRDMTLLAEACIKVALDYLHPMVANDFGKPLDSSGNEQKLLVIAMGKMGGGELNLSSDIDLIFAYPQSGETEGAKRSVSNQQFFERLGQKLIASLDAQTSDGFVFRVDMRLRPYGQSGPLVQNFAALEDYYMTQGRDWERFAMIKARVVAGDSDSAEKLQAILHPFVYRRYLDYGAIEALRDLKRKINLEVTRKGMQDNIKLGRGGIRELEFIVQSFQLIRGGRLQSLQMQSFQQALEQITVEELLEEKIKTQLWQAYQFLRNTEHIIQAIDDKQTQQLPIDELAQQRVATVMNAISWDEFLNQLDEHRKNVHQCFANMIADDETEISSEQQHSDLHWQPEMNADQSLHILRQLDYQQPEAIIETLNGFYASRAVISLAAVPRARLDALMPEVIRVCAAQEENDRTFSLVFNLIQAVLRRSVYLTLLIENTQALEQLALLCQRSAWIADQLTAFPDLLDELLDPRNLYATQDKSDLQDQLRQQTLRLDNNDLEQQMEVVRYFVRACNLRIAACEITGRLSLMEASDQLTWTAEVVVEHVTNVAWHQMAAKYGTPAPAKDKKVTSETPGFIVVAYGKVGGLEMGYKSDLDLVFLHDDLASETSGGPKSVDSSTFYARLGQRIIHLLSTPTHAGMAYEIDMRLRPSGNSGMLVSSLGAFEKYQQESAWTWEHQALVRSRVIAGDKTTALGFDAIRIKQLRKKRNIEKLRIDVMEMRTKMRKHLNKSTKDDKYCLKQVSGGIVDIEFMVQFAVLAWAHKSEQLVKWTDVVRLLEIIAKTKVLDMQQAQHLIEAYKTYRSAAHDLQLQNRPAEVLLSEFTEQRQAVQACWQSFLSNYNKED